MKGFRQTRTGISLAILGTGILSVRPSAAQETTNTGPARHFIKSPVEFFRELLAMTPQEQETFLASRSPEHRNRIEAKIAEYAGLDANERELRLQATELHWYMLPLLKMPAGERSQRLERIPPEMRKLVDQRLQTWSILPSPLTDDLIENERVARIFVQSEKVTTADLEKILADIPPSRRKRLEAGIARWQAMPEQQRRQICSRFNEFFDLTAEEKEKALNTLSDAERGQMDRTLQEFEKLPREQRAVCIRAFEKFTDMSLPERELFLRNAELWKAMPPNERQAWRDLVAQVPIWPLPVDLPESVETNRN
jgi:hypothetical protein